ncbi:translocator protein 2 [Bos taurus]|uniref:translocator protein 2 n=1 Tax=Bos taurus TaxID=9913 RepID=UPI000572DB83|nr:translocator protein 2 [Bos taurus]
MWKRAKAALAQRRGLGEDPRGCPGLDLLWEAQAGEECQVGGDRQADAGNATISVFSASPDRTSSRRMWPQGAIFVALPLLGPTLVWLLIHHSMSDWCDSLRKLPWCPPHRVLLLVWTTIYSITGYAASEAGSEARPSEHPELGSLAPGCCRKVKGNSQGSLPNRPAPAQALLHLLLLFGLVMSTALIWHPINKLATLLLLAYLAWLPMGVSITCHLWRDSLCPEDRPPRGE